MGGVHTQNLKKLENLNRQPLKTEVGHEARLFSGRVLIVAGQSAEGAVEPNSQIPQPDDFYVTNNSQRPDIYECAKNYRNKTRQRPVR